MTTYLKNAVLANDSNITTEAGVSIIAVNSSGSATVNTSVQTLVDLTTSGNTILGDTTSDTTLVNGTLTSTVGVQSSAVARTATTNADGTGVIAAGSTFVSVTSSADTKGVTLPTPVLGNIIYVKEVGANGYYVIPAATTQFINGTEVTGTKKLACAANTGVAVFLCVVGGAAGKWIQYYIDDDGTVDAGGSPA